MLTPTSRTRRIARWLSQPILALYLLQSGVVVYEHSLVVAEVDVCCDQCSTGGPCCCLIAAGVTSCDLVPQSGSMIRPAPCGGLGSTTLTSTRSLIDHLMPARYGQSVIHVVTVEGPIFTQAAHSVRLGPPEKIPIV
jgi:hypothetical protein